MNDKDTHCNFCGFRFLKNAIYPKKCHFCGQFIYRNPLPVVVCIVKVAKDNKEGLLIVKRNIQPKKGFFALPGGYIDAFETWQEAAARELKEETGLSSIPEDYSLFDVKTSLVNKNILVFALYNLIIVDLKEINDFKSNSEVSELDIAFSGRSLCFSTHQEVLETIYGKQ